MTLSYKNYYLRTINKGLHGIKLVLGGTGLGKTYGMREAVKEYLQSDIEAKKKLIYITNRHNLITEQKREFNKAGFKCCYLKSNREVILDLIKDGEIENLIEEFERIDFYKYDEILRNKYKRDAKLRKLIDGVRNKQQLIQRERGKDLQLIKAIDKEINLECDELFKIFKSQFILIGRNEEKLYEQLKVNEFIWKLFPYVEFENNPDANILLVTIHKVLLGFFDGKKDVKIASIEDKIIFLDEFDFLEQEIIKILCDEPSIINPLEFVRIFYEKFKHWSNAEFWEKSDELKGVKEKFGEVISFIEDKTKEKKLNFPGVIDFRLEKPSEEGTKPYLLFQTNEIITPKRFFLKEQSNSWYIQDEKTSDSVSPFELFNILAIATSKILGVFHYYQKNATLVSELIQTIWNQKNDNTGGRYEDYIVENCLYHRTKAKSGKDYVLYKDKSPYEIGFRLIKLAKRTNNFDPTSAELGQVELFTSPEAVIAKLSDSNLVFALSATTDIPRTLKCFNIEWLKENATFIPLDAEDFAIIKYRRDVKRDKRKTNVKLKIADQLKEDHPLSVIFKGLLENGTFSKTNDLDGSANPRYERLLRVFNTLYDSTNSDKFSHLIFVSTFSEIKGILDYKKGNNALVFIGIDQRVFNSTRIYSHNDRFYNVTLNGKECSVLLLNSEDAKELQENVDSLENYRKCFELKEKVFVITQYKSASNGVNLPCFQNMGTLQSDFEGIHLLEQNHFWFDNSEEQSQLKNNEKQALWYLWKLLDSGQIDTSQFKICLSARDPRNPYKMDIRKFNALYKDKADEKILNSIALFHQAIGRIERRDEELLEVDVTLDRQVFDDFHSFSTAEVFKDISNGREDITSSLILNVHKAVVEEGIRLNLRGELMVQKSISSKNETTQNLVREMLNEHAKVREGKYDMDVSSEIKSAWVELRDAVLKHDFDKRIHLEIIGRTIYVKRDLAFETKYINKKKEVFIDINKLKIYSEGVPNKKVTSWSLDSIYRIISKNSVICDYFQRNNYKMEFDVKPNLINHVFTPYAYQALLSGAIGEEAIISLLNYHGIDIENQNDLDNSIFEVVDAKVRDLPIYFDFKNFSTSTLDGFSLQSDDLTYNPDLSSSEYIEKIKLKYSLLKQQNKAPKTPVLYILNLYSQTIRKSDFFDENMMSVEYEKDSCIRIIPSVLHSVNSQEISPDFESLLKYINIHETASL